MNTTPEAIRRQMEETKSQLSDKLDSLESQVTHTVQSTGTAVNATVEAVQVTVEAVTGAVQGAVQSMSNAFDVRRQIDHHPWLVLGGAVALGYLAVEFLASPATKSSSLQANVPVPCPPANTGQFNRETMVESPATLAAIAAAYKSGRETSARAELQDSAIRALIGIVQDVATRAVPQMVDYFTGKLVADRVQSTQETGESRNSVSRHESTESDQRVRIASTEAFGSAIRRNKE